MKKEGESGAGRRLWVAVVVVAGALRVVWSLKYLNGDEGATVLNLIVFFQNHTLAPAHLNYPTLYSYLAAPATAIGSVIYYWLGIAPSPLGFGHLLTLESMLSALPARLTSAALGTATVYLVYRLGRRLGGEGAGLMAGALLALAPAHVDYSSYALPEAAMTFFAAACLWFCLEAAEGQRVRDYALAGAMAGLAASCKYNGVLIVLGLVPAYVAYLKERGALGRPWQWVDPRAVYAGVALVAAFCVGSPYWVIEPYQFMSAFRFEQGHMAEGHLGSFGLPYLRHLELLWHSEGTIALMFGAGVAYALWRRGRGELVVLTPVVLSFAYIGQWEKKDLHYLLFLYPALCVLGGEAAAAAGRTRGRAAITVIAAACLLWPGYECARGAWMMTRTDTRVEAVEWIQQNVPEGSRVIATGLHGPRLYSKEEKAVLEASPAGEFFRRRLGGVRTYRVILIQYSPHFLEKNPGDFLVLNSYSAALVAETPLPPRDSVYYPSYMVAREFFQPFIAGRDPVGYRLVKEFDTGKGPDTRIYRRNPGK